MESMLSTYLLNDSDLDYWNPDPNPLCSSALISSRGSDHRVSESFFDKDVSQTVKHPLSDAWRQESNDTEQFCDKNSSSTWLENKENIDQASISQTSPDEELFPANGLCPQGINEASFLSPMDKDSDSLLPNDVLITSSFYSPIKDTSIFNNEEPVSFIQTSDIGEFEGVSPASSCQDNAQNMWRAVGIMETTSDQEMRSAQSLAQPQSGKGIPSSIFGTTTTAQYSVTNKIHSQPLLDRGHHPFVSSTPIGWIHRSAQCSGRNHVRLRKSRCRKPLFHNFQSNFFRLPIQTKSTSPQLQMVKLIRSNAVNSESQSSLEDVTSKPEGNPALKPSDNQHAEENPEIALMKTVDMPSGKRVEDIYVVPSVWISGQDSNADGKNIMQTEPSGSISQNARSRSHQIEDESMYPKMDFHHNDTEACNSQSLSSFVTPPQVSPGHAYAGVSMSSSLTEMSWPGGTMNHNSKNLIITTLNAPKLEVVPCLRNLCKAALNNSINSQSDPTKNHFACNKDTLSEAKVNGHSPRSTINFKDQKPDEQIHLIRDSTNAMNESTESQTELPNLDEADIINSLDFQDPPILDAITSPNGMKGLYDKEQASYDPEEDSGIQNPSLSTSYQDNLTSNVNTSMEDDLPSLDAIVNNTPDPIPKFPTTQAHMTVSNSCESISSSLNHANEGFSEQTQTMSSHPEPSSSSSFIDSPFGNEIEEEEPFNTPELVTLMRQIKELHINDPINKPLSNLSTTLHLLHDAEKTLCNANFGVYHQLKNGQHSKFGHLIRCILSLTSTVIMMGKSLYEWTRSSSDNQSMKTVEVLSNLYHTNIINLIELITPYFHYLCGLIASCHSDVHKLNKTKVLSDESPEKAHSYGTLHSTKRINEVIIDKTTLCNVGPNFTQMPNIHTHSFNFNDQNKNVFRQNNATKCVQSEDETHLKVHGKTIPLCHKRTISPKTNNHQKRPKISLLKHRMPIANKGIPYMGPSDLKTSLIDKKNPSVKPNASAAKTLLVNVNSSRMYSSARTSILPHQSHVQTSLISQNKMAHQTKSSVDTYANYDPCVVSYRAPLRNGSKNLS